MDDFLANCIRAVTDVLMQMQADSLQYNAENASRAGLEARVTRTYDGVGLSNDRQCEWCLDRCGNDVPYSDALAMGMFQRHPGCGCEISYTSKKGITSTQSRAGGRESWTEEKAENRRKYGLEKSQGPARHELVKRMTEGQSNPQNQGVIAERVLTKDYSLQQRHQKYLQHVKGTAQYNDATNGQGRPQSYLIVSEEDAQNIIYDCAGRGIIDFDKNGTPRSMEFITLDRYIGEYYEKGAWHKTRRIQIMHSKHGAHIVPVKER